jgi:DNA-binding NarL/FixJ family response regulator
VIDVEKIRVLVVDDSRMSHAMMDGIISKTDFEICDYAKTSAEAIEKYKILNPDVVTMDMNLPDADGLECSQRILELNPHAKIVMVSAMRDASLMMQGRAIGISAFVQKPLNENELIDTLRMVFQSTEDSLKILEESYVKTFIKVLQKNLFSLAGVHSDMRYEISTEGKLEIDGIAIIIGFTGKPVGRAIVHTDFDTMNQFARAILGRDTDEIISDEEANECMEETANIVAGRSVSMINDIFKDKELRITPPGIIVGKKLSIVNPKLITFNIVASTKLGDLKMNIGFAGGE